MASIDKVPTGWRVRFRDPEGASRSKNFKRKVDAERFRTAIEHARLSHTYVDPSAGNVTFKTFAEQWRQTQMHRSASASLIDRRLRLHVYPRIGSRRLGSIRRLDVQALVKAMSTGDEERRPLAPNTVRSVFSWVTAIFRTAVEDRVIPSNPCTGVKLPDVADAPVVPLAVETVAELVDGIDPRYRAFVVLGAGTGVRISEALALTTDRVDWLRGSVTINRQLVRVRAGVPEFGPVKDRRNRPRTIPVPQVLVDELADHLRQYGPGPEGLVFTNSRGRAFTRGDFSVVWRKAAEPLGIPTGDGYHLLRHFYASVLIRAGESVKVVQNRLGHASAVMTLDVYGHLWGDDDDTTRDAVAAVLGPRPKDPASSAVSSPCHDARDAG